MNTAQLGISAETIQAAAAALGVTFPDELHEIWKISNGLELPGGWRFFPVFDPANARKTSNNIVYENTKGRWSCMPEDLVAIAHGDTGNCLVLQKVEGALAPEVFLWDHETNKTRRWSRSLEFIREKAAGRVAKIAKQIAKSRKKTGK